jgi:hypothetical protein
VSFTLLIDTARAELVARDFVFGANFFETCLRDFSVMAVARCVLLVAVRIRARPQPEYSGKY